MSKKTDHFEVPQYWKACYQETRPNGEVVEFKTVLRAKSKDFARKILLKKIEEDSPGASLNSARFYRFHKLSEVNGRKISITDWAHIRDAAFPNEVNILFKKQA